MIHRIILYYLEHNNAAPLVFVSIPGKSFFDNNQKIPENAKYDSGVMTPRLNKAPPPTPIILRE